MASFRQNWLFLAVCCAAFPLSGCSGPTAVPSSYSTYANDQKIFKIDYPDGWSSQSASRMDYSEVKFCSGGTEIEVQADIATRALLAEIAQTGIHPGNPNEPGSAVSAQNAHWLEKPTFESQNGVKEEKSVTATTKLGNGVKSEFTGTDTFGNDIHGYRATSMNNDKRIRVVCRCPEDEWQTLKPVFDTVIVSVSENP
jgi:hypothetical protein